MQTSYRFGGCGGTESPPSFLGLQSQGGNKGAIKVELWSPNIAIGCSLKT